MIKFFNESLFLYVFLLAVIWPLGHVIAVRNILIGLIFINSIFLFYLNKKNGNIKNFYKDNESLKLGILLCLFFIWVLIISIFSPFKNYSLHEYIHQFFPLILLGISGYFIVNSLQNYKKIFEAIFWGMFILVIYHVLYSLHYYIYYKQLPLRSYGIVVGLDEINFMMPYIFSFFAVEFIARIFKQKHFLLNVSNSTLVFFILLSIFSIIVQNKRNGYISLIFLIVSLSFFYYLYNIKNNKLNLFNKKLLMTVIISILFSVTLGFIDYKLDPRWKDFKKTFNIVFIQDNLDWYQHKIPKGTDDSTYRRMFYYKESLKFFNENIWGYGFGRNIFSKIASKKYNINYHDHAHSGILNIILGEGFLGFILFSLIMFILMYIGIKNFLLYESFFGLLLFYLSTSFYFRNFLDALFKNHYLQQFVFLAVLSFFAMKREMYEKDHSS